MQEPLQEAGGGSLLLLRPRQCWDGGRSVSPSSWPGRRGQPYGRAPRQNCRGRARNCPTPALELQLLRASAASAPPYLRNMSINLT